jgi:hypothetical protein
MTELNTKVQQVANSVEKAIGEQASRIEVAMGEVTKLQSVGLDQAAVLVETASRIAKDQLAFAEQLMDEWRKLVLAATRSAAELFAPKKA